MSRVGRAVILQVTRSAATEIKMARLAVRPIALAPSPQALVAPGVVAESVGRPPAYPCYQVYWGSSCDEPLDDGPLAPPLSDPLGLSPPGT